MTKYSDDKGFTLQASTTRRRFMASVAGGVIAAPAIIKSAQAASNVLRIGHPGPLSGPSGLFGARARDGSFMAMKEINDAGGFTDSSGAKRTIEVVSEDYADDAHQAVTLFRHYAEDQSMTAVVGPLSSTGWVPCVPIAAELKMPLIGNGSLATISNWNTWSYRVNPISTFTIPALMKAVVAATKIKRLAIIYDQTNDGQVSAANLLKSEAPKIGYEVVAFEAYRAGDQDFSVAVANIKAAKADSIFLCSQTAEGVRISPQLKSAGLDLVQIIEQGNFADPKWWDQSRGTVVGGYTYLYVDLNPKSGKLREWLDAYSKLYGMTPTSHSIAGYTSVMAVVEAVKKAGSVDRDKVRQALQSLSFTTPLGTQVSWKNPPDGNNLSPSITVVKVTGKGTYDVVS